MFNNVKPDTTVLYQVDRAASSYCAWTKDAPIYHPTENLSRVHRGWVRVTPSFDYEYQAFSGKTATIVDIGIVTSMGQRLDELYKSIYGKLAGLRIYLFSSSLDCQNMYAVLTPVELTQIPT